MPPQLSVPLTGDDGIMEDLFHRDEAVPTL